MRFHDVFFVLPPVFTDFFAFESHSVVELGRFGGHLNIIIRSGTGADPALSKYDFFDFFSGSLVNLTAHFLKLSCSLFRMVLTISGIILEKRQ